MCLKCEEKFIKIFLWQDYLKEIQALESDLNLEKEEFEVYREKLRDGLLSYKGVESKHSHKLKEYVDQLDQNRAQKKKLREDIESKSIKIAELHVTEQNNNTRINFLTTQGEEKRRRMHEMQVETHKMNESNREYLEIEASLQSDVKNLLNSIYQKKNWQREAFRSSETDINKSNTGVGRNRLINKNAKNFKADDGSCRCNVF